MRITRARTLAAASLLALAACGDGGSTDENFTNAFSEGVAPESEVPDYPPPDGLDIVAAPPSDGAKPEAPVDPARARANLASYISQDDYPAAALRDRAQGRVAFALDVGPDGRVTGCTVTSSSGSSALDGATCRIMRSRARFVPARDAQGHVVADSVSAEVTWTLPPA